VAELVDRADGAEEAGERAVDEERAKQERHGPRPVGGGNVQVRGVGERAGGGEKGELRNDLEKAAEVTRPHEFAHDGAVDRGAIPVDFDRVVHGTRERERG
jgi:hypothetical protein